MPDLSRELTEKFNTLHLIKQKIMKIRSFIKGTDTEGLLAFLDQLLDESTSHFAMQLEAVSLPDTLKIYSDIIHYYAAAFYRGKTLLMFAAENNHIDLVVDLLACENVQVNMGREDLSYDHDSGDDFIIFEGEEHGYSALMYAVERGHFKVAELLIRSFADVCLANSAGKNSFDLAISANQIVMRQLLKKAYRIHAEEIFWILMRCGKENIPPLIEMQTALNVPKKMVIEYLLHENSDSRYKAILLKYALKVNTACEPSNALALYMATDFSSFFGGKDTETINLLSEHLKDFEDDRSLSTNITPVTVISVVGKPSLLSYSLSYGPQQTLHPLNNKNAIDMLDRSMLTF